ncbi:MAG: tRNA dihydrouridine synthase DusB [Actinomycetota bacterium]
MKKRMHAVLVARREGAPPARAAEAAGAWPAAEPFAIGGLRLANRVVQAPLAGIANWAFRRQSRRHGAGLAISEMIASLGLRHGNRKTLDMLALAPDERPTGIQVFGADPDAMAEAARAAEQAGADLVDVNMGCPVPKVCKTGAGAALLDDPSRAEAIVAAMVRAVRIPVTVKMRRGVRVADARPVETARRLVDAGAAAVFFHPRAATEEYAGTADHSVTAQVVAAVDVPVIASGDVTGPAEAAAVLRDTGCAAVAVGRAALGNPWVFGAIATGHPAAPPSLADVAREVEAFAADARAALGDDRACAYLRKFYPWYLAAHDVPAARREALVTAPTLDEALTLLRDLVEPPPDRARQPRQAAAAA